MIALDLFGGGGGAGMGYVLAGFDVIGIDEDCSLAKFYSHVGEFHCLDWREGLERFAAQADLIHASPPCQDYSLALRHLARRGKKVYPRLIEPVRDALRASGKPWVMENTPGAPLAVRDTLFGDYGVELCGTMFGKRIQRHRLFETSFPVSPPGICDHRALVINPHNKESRKRYREEFGDNSERHWRKEMGVEWINDDHIAREAIPPCYTQHLAKQFLQLEEAA
jgi:DNA (cytosine-5)-methyltransferase 1